MLTFTTSAEVIPETLIVALPLVVLAYWKIVWPGPFGDVIFVQVPTAPDAGSAVTAVAVTTPAMARIRTRRFISPPAIVPFSAPVADSGGTLVLPGQEVTHQNG